MDISYNLSINCVNDPDFNQSSFFLYDEFWKI